MNSIIVQNHFAYTTKNIKILSQQRQKVHTKCFTRMRPTPDPEMIGLGASSTQASIPQIPTLNTTRECLVFPVNFQPEDRSKRHHGRVVGQLGITTRTKELFL